MKYFLSFLSNSAAISAVIFVFFILSPFFRKKISAKIRYAVWIVILAGLLVPLNFIFHKGFIFVQVPNEAQFRQVIVNINENHFEESYKAVHKTEKTIFSVTPFTICIIIYGLITAIIFFYHILQYFNFLGLIKRWGIPVKDEFTLSLFRLIQEKMGLGGKKIKLRVCEFASSSLLTGIFKPVVVLPEKYFEPDELELIFRHELTHLKNRDLFIKLLSVVAASFHWFNPFVYLLNFSIQSESEASCDEIVLINSGAENRQFYAELMIKMISEKKNNGIMLSTCFYRNKKNIKKRLDAILNITKKSKVPAYAVFTVFFVLTVFSNSAFAVNNKNSDLNKFENITLEQAKKAAIDAIGGGSFGRYEIKYDQSGNIYHYKIIFAYENYMYDVDVDGLNGEIKKIEKKPITITDQNISSTEQIIEAKTAKAIAAKAAGSGVIVECRLEKLSRENIVVYHIHVDRDQWEYCVKINAYTGLVHELESRYFK